MLSCVLKAKYFYNILSSSCIIYLQITVKIVNTQLNIKELNTHIRYNDRYLGILVYYILSIYHQCHRVIISSYKNVIPKF